MNSQWIWATLAGCACGALTTGNYRIFWIAIACGAGYWCMERFWPAEKN